MQLARKKVPIPIFFTISSFIGEGKGSDQNTVTGVGENGNKSVADNVDNTGQNSERTEII
jgi:hypothetical protein